MHGLAPTFPPASAFPIAGLFLPQAAGATAAFRDRCGTDALMLVGTSLVSSLESVRSGDGLGDLRVDFENVNGTIHFDVEYRSVDELDFQPLAERRRTGLPANLDAVDMAIALSAVHETAKAHLFDPGLDRALDVVADLSPAGVAKLRY